MLFHCQTCGKPFERSPSRAKHGRARNCSAACQHRANRDRFSRPETWEEKTCIGCERPFTVRKSWLASRKGAGKYCTRACRDEFRVKEKHPQFLNGRASERRGPNWQAQKRRAIERDQHKCQNCPAKAEDVHHIVPFRMFGIERFMEANDLANLVSLCKPCHRKADAKFQG